MSECTFWLKRSWLAVHFSHWEVAPNACICAARTLSASTIVYVVPMQSQILNSYMYFFIHKASASE